MGIVPCPRLGIVPKPCQQSVHHAHIILRCCPWIGKNDTSNGRRCPPIPLSESRNACCACSIPGRFSAGHTIRRGGPAWRTPRDWARAPGHGSTARAVSTTGEKTTMLSPGTCVLQSAASWLALRQYQQHGQLLDVVLGGRGARARAHEESLEHVARPPKGQACILLVLRQPVRLI